MKLLNEIRADKIGESNINRFTEDHGLERVD